MDHEEEIRQLTGKAFKNEELYRAYYEVAEVRTFKKGEYLGKEGQVCRHCYNIVSGVVRGYYRKDDKEVTTSFCFDGDTVFSLESATRNMPANEIFEVLEDAVVEVISFSDLEKLRKQFPDLEKLWVLGVEAYAIWLEERLYSLQFNTAIERYRLLLKKYPFIIQKVQLTFIASYLGISKETLSRIRAQEGII